MDDDLQRAVAKYKDNIHSIMLYKHIQVPMEIYQNGMFEDMSATKIYLDFLFIYIYSMSTIFTTKTELISAINSYTSQNTINTYGVISTWKFETNFFFLTC